MPPIAKPFPRFIANSPQEGVPYGRWAERLTELFEARCEPLIAEAGAGPDLEKIRWFPERSWGGRTYVPLSTRATGPNDDGVIPEWYGHVSFIRHEEGDPTELEAMAEFTDVTIEDNPDWAVDLNDDVIGTWESDGGRGGEVTLIWGLPMRRGAIAATAEIEGDGSDLVLDQSPVNEGRFTLIATDAIHGFGPDRFLEIRLWDRRLNLIAAESLYDDAGEDSDGAENGTGEN